MKLSIRFGYLYPFTQLLGSDDYLRMMLGKKSSLVYDIVEGSDVEYIESVLKNRNINFVIV